MPVASAGIRRLYKGQGEICYENELDLFGAYFDCRSHGNDSGSGNHVFRGFAPPRVCAGIELGGADGRFHHPFCLHHGFHYLDTGNVVGGYMQTSVTTGMFKRVEFGYTRTLSMGGTTLALSPLFEGGFNTVHGKVNLIPENAWKKKYMPAISWGFVARTQVRHVGGVLSAKDTSNGDLYMVATKTVTQVKGLPFVVSLGFKQTNASLFGIAGNASAWQGRFFGATAFVFTGPAKSTLIIGSEFAQQPHFIEGLQGATVPTSFTYFVRIVPAPEKLKLNVDFGVAQAIGATMPGVELAARGQFAMGVSYQF